MLEYVFGTAVAANVGLAILGGYERCQRRLNKAELIKMALDSSEPSIGNPSDIWVTPRDNDSEGYTEYQITRCVEHSRKGRTLTYYRISVSYLTPRMLDMGDARERQFICSEEIQNIDIYPPLLPGRLKQAFNELDVAFVLGGL